MRRFTGALRDGLGARGHAVTVLTPSLRVARLGPRYHYNGVPKYLGYLDKFVLFPRQLRRHVRTARPDVVHLTDQAGAVYGSALRGVPVLATCHDLMEIRAARGEIAQQRVSRGGRVYQAWIHASLGRLPQFACVSRPTRDDLLRLTSLAPERVQIIPNALHYPYQPIPAETARQRIAGLDPRLADTLKHGFLLQIGGEQWYKNRPGLLQIYAGVRRLVSSPPNLVMVGPPLSVAHATRAAELGVAEHIVSLRGLDNARLEALYSLAQGLVFPSWEEGFGWPVAEAQTCGCPVFASNRAPMTEVGGRHAVYFDPADPDGSARTIADAWPRRHALRAPAMESAARWRPGHMIDAYEALYRRIST